MEKKEEKRLYPGDVGYKGGVTVTNTIVNGRHQIVRTVTDPSGRPMSVIVIDRGF